MDSTALGRDNVAFSFLRSLSFTLTGGIGTESWKVELPVGCGLVIINAYGVIDDAAGVPTLSVDQFATWEYNNNSFASCSYFKKITDRNQTLTIQSDNTGTVTGTLYLYAVYGSNESWAFSDLVASANTDYTTLLARPGEGTLCIFAADSISNSQITGTKNRSWNTVFSASSVASLNVQHRAAAEVVSYGTSINGGFFEIVPKDKPRRKRFITREEVWTTQPLEPVELDWDNPLLRGVEFVMLGSHPFYNPAGAPQLSTAGYGIKRATPNGAGVYVASTANCAWYVLRNPNVAGGWTHAGVVMPLSSYSGQDQYVAGVYNFAAEFDRSIAASVSGQYWEAYAYDGTARRATSSVSATVNRADTIVAASDGANLYCKVNATEEATTPVSADGYLAYAGTVYFAFGAASNNALPATAIPLLVRVLRCWTKEERASFTANPWQIFKRRRVLFNGTPVIEHKRRRVL